MRFAIRDDDISYFTEPDQLEKVYSGIWEKCPISLAVIPFLHGSANFVPDAHKNDRVYPIGENKSLIRFIRKKINEGRVSVMLHGYSHRRDSAGHEFEHDSNLREKIREGKQYLEGLFDTQIRCFVAPNHAFSKEGMLAVSSNGLDIVGAPSVKARPKVIGLRHMTNMIRLSVFRAMNKGVKYHCALSYGSHRELYCYGIVPSTGFDELRKGLEFSQKKDGVFCVAVHSNNMTDSMLSLLRQVFTKSEGMRPEYISVDEAFRP